MQDLKPEVVKDLDTYFRKKIPNLFRSRTNEENSEKEEREPLLKSKKEITFYDHGSIDDMTLSNNHLLFKEQKGSMFSSCWRGLGRCYQKIPSLNTCWKGVKKGFTFLFSSCRKRSKDRELNIYHTDDDDFEREKLIN